MESQGKVQNKLGDLGHLEEIPEPRAGLALGPGLLPPPLALPAGGTWGIEGLAGASAKDWDMGGHVRAAVPLFHPGKTTIHLRQVSKPLPNLEVQPAACASPVCSRPGTGILPPPRGTVRGCCSTSTLKTTPFPPREELSQHPAGRTAMCSPPPAPFNSHPSPHFFLSRALACQCHCREGKEGTAVASASSGKAA